MLGLTERSFPPPPRQDPLLLDDERERLNELGAVTLPLRGRGPDPEPLQFALAVGAARERLLLSTRRAAEAGGRAQLPSSFFRLAASALAGDGSRPTGSASSTPASTGDYALAGSAPTAPTARSRSPSVTSPCSRSSQSLGTAILHRHAPATRGADRLRRARWGDRMLTPFDGVIAGDEAVAALAAWLAESAPLSPTMLEAYATCPYRYFLDSLLRVKPLEEPARSSSSARSPAARRSTRSSSASSESTRRSTCSESLGPSCSRAERDRRRRARRRRRRADWRGAAALERSRTEIVDDLAAGSTTSSPIRRLRGARLRGRVRRPLVGEDESPLARRAARARRRRPGASAARPDRPARMDAERGFRVIDYKSGSNRRKGGFNGGRALQLPLYLLAGANIVIGVEHGSSVVFLRNPSRRVQRAHAHRPRARRRARELRGVLGRIVGGIGSGDFHAEPDRTSAASATSTPLRRRPQADPERKREDERVVSFAEMRGDRMNFIPVDQASATGSAPSSTRTSASRPAPAPARRRCSSTASWRCSATGHATVDEIAVITFTEAAAAELAARVRQGLEVALEKATDPAEQQADPRGARRPPPRPHRDDPRLLREPAAGAPGRGRLDPGFEVRTTSPRGLSFEAAYDALADRAPRRGAHRRSRSRPTAGSGSTASARSSRWSTASARCSRSTRRQRRRPTSTASSRSASGRRRVHLLLPLAAGDDKAASQIEAIIAFDRRLCARRRATAMLERELLFAAPKVLKTAGAQKNWDDPALPALEGAAQRAARGDRGGPAGPAHGGDRRRAAARATSSSSSRNERRRKAGDADFDDLLEWARDLLATAREAREYFRERFKVVLVDEFQDTDPVQADIALLIASDDEPGETCSTSGRGRAPDRRRRPEAVDLPVPAGRHRGLRRHPPRPARRRGAAARPELPLGRGRPRLGQRGLRPRPRRAGRRPAREHPARPGDGALADESLSVCVVHGEPEDSAEEARTEEALLIAATIRRAVDEALAGPRPRHGAASATYATSSCSSPPHRPGALRGALRRSASRTRRGRPLVLPAPGGARPLEHARGDRRPARPGAPRRALRSSAFGCTDEELYLHVARGGRLDYRAALPESPERREALAAARPATVRSGASLAQLVRETLERTRWSRSRSPAGTASSRPRTW